LAKAKAKKQLKGKQQKRSFPWLWVTIGVFIPVFVAAFCFMASSHNLVTPANPKDTRAAIVDQLYTSYPNEDFTTEVTKELEGYGFEVDLYQGNNVTVDFYRNLPSKGYRLIVLRSHSGAVRASSQYVGSIIGTYLFTNEPYSTIKYPKEQWNNELARARVTESSPDLFAIGAKFISNSMEGNFNNTVIIIDGCSCLYNDDLAQAFAQKGASAYLAWDATVDLDYVDRATACVVKQLCKKDATVSKAVMNTMAVVGADLKYGAVLRYYPLENGGKTLKELIQ